MMQQIDNSGIEEIIMGLNKLKIVRESNEEIKKALETENSQLLSELDKRYTLAYKEQLYAKYVNERKFEKYNEDIMKIILLRKNKSKLYDYNNIFISICYTGQHEVLKVFLKKGYEVDKDNLGPTHAAAKGFDKIIDLLIEYNYNMNIENYSPLVNAIVQGHEKIVTKLLTLIEDKSFSNSVLLFVAIDNQQLTISEILLENGVKVNDTCFNLACEKGNDKFVKLLMKYSSEKFFKALKVARKYKRKNVIVLLRKNGFPE